MLSRSISARGLLMLAALVFAFAFAGSASAQNETGQIFGKVTDPNGAVVPNATVTLKAVETGAQRTTTTDDAGNYIITNIQPALYDITASASGFAPVTQRIQVTVGSRNSQDLTLGITGAKEQVNVVASEGGVEVNTQTPELSNVVSETQVKELPSVTRNPYDFVVLSGSVSTDPSGSTGRGVGVAINGQRAASTNVLLNGVDNNNTFTAAVGQTVPLDSVQEYRVITNSFGAEYGRASGGIVNVATKSGTNDFHGTLYEFNRISRLASNGFFNNANGNPRGVFTRNQFGYSIGGPVILPRFGEGGPATINEKNKVFFFNSFEWLRVRSTGTNTVLVPTPQLIAASSPATQAFFAGQQLVTPINGPVYTVGQVVALRNIGAGAFKSLPASLPAFGTVNYTTPRDLGAGFPQNRYFGVARVDWNVSDATQVYFFYGRDSGTFFPGFASVSPYAGFSTGEKITNNDFVVSLTHTFSSRFVSQTKLSYNRLNDFQPLSGPPQPTLYIGANTPGSINGITINFPGYLPSSPGSAIPFGGPQNLGQVLQDFNYAFGHQTLRFGAQFVYLQDNRVFGAYENPVEALSQSNNFTVALNNFVLGRADGFNAAIFPQGKFPGQQITLPVGPPDFSRSNRYRDYALYVQDAYRVRSRVTLNLGLRYEYYDVQHNKNPNLDSNFYYPGDSLTPTAVRNGTVQLAPNSPVGRLWRPDRNNFAPRLGIAWDVFGDGKTSVRAGYGIAYERNFGNVTFNVIQNPPNYAVIAITPADVGGVLPITTSLFGPLAGSSGTRTLPPVSLRAVDPNIKTAYAHIYSASVEHQLAPGTLVSLEYSGSYGLNQYTITNVNRQFSGLFYLNDSNKTNNPSLRLNSQYGNINFRGSSGFSRYNGLTASIESNNFRNLGLSLTARYTYSVAKDTLSSTFSEGQGNGYQLGLLDPFNPGLDYGYADYDVRHRFTGSFIYEVPTERYFDSKAAKLLLGGWSITGIITANSGTPFTVIDCSNAFSFCPRLVPSAALSFKGQKNPPSTGAVDSFKYLDLSNQTPGNYINSKLGISDFGPFPANMTKRNAFRGPGAYNIDAGLYKRIKFSERYSLQLRAEAYNLLNHANLFVDYSSLDISSNSFVNAYRSGNRNVQLAVKFIF
jgi:hypothetical protein